MKNLSSDAGASSSLREKAEAQFREIEAMSSKKLDALSPESLRTILHELRVHQIELEMQNEELRRAQEDLAASRGRYFDLYDLAPVGYITVSEAGIVLEANLTAATLFGMDRRSLVKQPVSRLILKEDQDIFYELRRRLFETGDTQRCELRMVRPDGSTFWACLDGAAAKDGDVARSCRMVLSDITQCKLMRDALESTVDRLRLATKAGGVGIWDWDIANNILVWDDQMYRLYGITHDQSGEAYETWREGLHPDDRQRGDEEVQMALRGEKDFNTEFRVLWPNGEIHHLRALAFVQRDAVGEPLHMIGTNWDITDQISTREALKIALRRAEASAAAKSEFLGVMSHELRTPLNGVLGFAEILADTPLNEEQKDCVRTIASSGEHLLAIVNDILDFSSIEHGTPAIHAAPLTIAELIESSEVAIRLGAAAKGIGFRCEVAPGVPKQILGDERRIRQILINLLGNAVKFTSAGSVVLRVISDPGGRFLEFSVEDTGIGMPPETMEILFDPFAQADMKLNRTFGGTGLGLAISMRLAEAMGGSISVESTPGKGSTFTFRLPLEAVSGAVSNPSGKPGGPVSTTPHAPASLCWSSRTSTTTAASQGKCSPPSAIGWNLLSTGRRRSMHLPRGNSQPFSWTFRCL
jgi:PAS domain S-box-containing protein